MFVNLLDLYKAKSHKYTHKRRVYIKGKPAWRYYYKEHHGGGVANVELFLWKGEAFKVNYKGKEGHFKVLNVKDGMVTVVHDETGKETTLSKSELRQVLLKTHAKALKENVEKKKQTLTKRKSAKAKERAQQALDRAKSKIDGLEDEPKQKKQDGESEEITDLIEGLFPPAFRDNMSYRHEILIADTDDDAQWEEAEGQILGNVRNKEIMIRFDKNVILSDYQARLYGEKEGISKINFNGMLDDIKDRLKAKSVEEKRLGEIIIEFEPKKQEQKKQKTDVESVLREVNEEFELKKPELEKRSADRAKKKREQQEKKKLEQQKKQEEQKKRKRDLQQKIIDMGKKTRKQSKIKK